MAYARGHAMLIGGSFGSPVIDNFKVKVEYNDGTPTFEVPLDGSTIVTQADGDSINNNHDISKISKMTIGDSMSELGSQCFNAWTIFSGELVLPNSLTTISDYALGSWRAYNRDTVIPNSVTSIGIGAFNSWRIFDSIFTLPNNITSLSDDLFNDWLVFNQPFIVPDSVTSIGVRTFYLWETFNNTLTLSSNLLSIGMNGISYFNNLNTQITIPDSVTNIGDDCFQYWHSYTKEFIFEAVTPPIFGNNVYPNWSSPVKIITGSGADDCEWKTALTNSNHNDEIESINGELWDDICDNFKIRMEYTDGTPTFEVPLDGSTIVTQANGDSAIDNYDETKISKMIIGNAMTEIADEAFMGMYNDRWRYFNSEVVLPNSLTIIGDGAFNSWWEFNQPFTIPDSVTSIGEYAFRDWFEYNKNFVFDHTDTIPTLEDFTFFNWKDYFPARITTPNSTHTNSEWKTAIGDDNYNGGDIESINGVLWNNIP